jgi:hypothetical protein
MEQLTIYCPQPRASSTCAISTHPLLRRPHHFHCHGLRTFQHRQRLCFAPSSQQPTSATASQSNSSTDLHNSSRRIASLHLLPLLRLFTSPLSPSSLLFLVSLVFSKRHSLPSVPIRNLPILSQLPSTLNGSISATALPRTKHCSDRKNDRHLHSSVQHRQPLSFPPGRTSRPNQCQCRIPVNPSFKNHCTRNATTCLQQARVGKELSIAATWGSGYGRPGALCGGGGLPIYPRH